MNQQNQQPEQLGIEDKFCLNHKTVEYINKKYKLNEMLQTSYKNPYEKATLIFSKLDSVHSPL